MKNLFNIIRYRTDNRPWENTLPRCGNTAQQDQVREALKVGYSYQGRIHGLHGRDGWVSKDRHYITDHRIFIRLLSCMSQHMEFIINLKGQIMIFKEEIKWWDL